MHRVAKWIGLDAAIVGVSYRCGEPRVLVYDRSRMVEILMGMDMTREEAEEYVDVNISEAWIGDTTPQTLEMFSEEQKAEIEREGVEAVLGVDQEEGY